MAALNRDQELEREVVGLLPAGGQAKRIAPLPCSKELYPIGFRPAADGRGVRPKVASHYLLEKMRLAGITKAYIVLRDGKWDIPGYFGDGSMLNMNLAYLMMGLPLGPAYTLDQAYPFVQNALVAFGFPDIIFQAEDAYKRLLMRQSAAGADVVLGLFPAHEPQELDMVDLDHEGRVRSIVIKPRQSRLQYTWNLAVWTPAFSRFMHEYLTSIQKLSKPKRTPEPSEMSVGHAFQAAIRNDLKFESVAFDDNTWLDIGTPDDLVKAIQNFS
jgi:glucose-1-phosphate thymidylyltransferase